MNYSFVHVFLGSEIPPPPPPNAHTHILLFGVDLHPHLQMLIEKYSHKQNIQNVYFCQNNCIVVADGVIYLPLFALLVLI